MSRENNVKTDNLPNRLNHKLLPCCYKFWAIASVYYDIYHIHICIYCLCLPARDFLSSLRQWRAYYGGLADQLCVRELASADSLSCWNGADVVRR